MKERFSCAHSSPSPRKTRIEYDSMTARYLLGIAAVSAAFCSLSCSAPPTGKSLAADAIAAMGGDKVKAVQTITMKGGSGSRTRLQEQRHVTDAEDPGTLKNVVEIVDIKDGRASLDYEFNEGGFGQHRREVLTSRGGKKVGIEAVDTRPVVATSPGGLFSWGTQNSPLITLRRNIVSILTQ